MSKRIKSGFLLAGKFSIYSALAASIWGIFIGFMLSIECLINKLGWFRGSISLVLLGTIVSFFIGFIFKKEKS